MAGTATTARRLVGAGAAGAAAVLAVAPMAHADARPKPAADPSGAAAATTGGQATATKATPDTKQAPVTPNYGIGKVRIGVRIKSGAYVPAGTTTAGTKISITETGPNASFAAQVFGTECTTVARTDVATPTETVCNFDNVGPALRRSPALQRKAAAAGMDVKRLLAADPPRVDYAVFPGDTVTFKQTTVNPNLLIDPAAQSYGPCVAPVNNGLRTTAADTPPTCGDSQNAAEIVLNDAGLPPVAKNDSGIAPPGGTVTINVVGNDTTEGAPPEVKIIEQPAHGTAKVIHAAAATVRGAAGALKQLPPPAIVYTPDAGFIGHDSLRYSLTTANGTSDATVLLRVAAPPTARDDSATTDAGSAVTIDVLANDKRNGGGALSIDSVGDPGHGSAKIRNGQVVYTPDAGFAGTDRFTYVAANSLGTDTATVTVTVNGVANTGVQSGDLLGIAALLVATGGAATVAGRRRYRARHAGGA